MSISALFFKTLLELMGIGGAFWTIVGIPVGIVWIIAFSLGHNRDKAFPVRNWLWTTLGGMGLLLLSFGLYTAVSYFAPEFGERIFQLP